MSISINRLVFLTLFLEGFVSVSLQVIFLRQLMPFVGNDVVMVGIIIGVFLAALSISYVIGGNAVNPVRRLRMNFILAALWLGVGSSYYALSASLGSFVGYGSPYVLGTIYLLVAMAPIVILLGQTLPILTGMVKYESNDENKNKISLVSGFSLSLNTVGSVIGAVGTPIILFSTFGVGVTILINVIALVLLCFLAILLEKKQSGGHNVHVIGSMAASGTFIIVVSIFLNVVYEKTQFILSTSYANYKVSQMSDGLGNHSRMMDINRSAASVLVNNDTISYVNYLHEYLINKLQMRNHDVLIMGAGGFTFSYNDDTNNRYVYVDIDSEIKGVAEKFFLESEIKGDFVADDARQYIKTKKEQFDVIFVDLYSNRFSMPWHLTTKQFLANVSDGLKENGYVFINYIHAFDFASNDAKRFDNTVRSVFDYCYSIPLVGENGTPSEHINLVYICEKPIEGSTREVNVDDRNYVN